MHYDEYVRKIGKLPLDQQREVLGLLEELTRTRARSKARTHFLPFVKTMWPDFIEGSHHRIIAELFDDVIAGRKKRIIVNMPPRHTKSEFASVLLPSFFLGQYPNKKVIQSSHTAELAVGFGRKVQEHHRPR